MVTSLGGRAAEEILLDGEYSQGAHGDLSAATNLALAMATQYGMTRLGLMVRSDEVLGAGGMEEVNLVVEELLSDAREKALRILNENKKLLELISAELLDKETLNHAEIIELRNKIKPASILKNKVKKTLEETQVASNSNQEISGSILDKASIIIDGTSKLLKRYIKKRARG